MPVTPRQKFSRTKDSLGGDDDDGDTKQTSLGDITPTKSRPTGPSPGRVLFPSSSPLSDRSTKLPSPEKTSSVVPLRQQGHVRGLARLFEIHLMNSSSPSSGFTPNPRAVETDMMPSHSSDATLPQHALNASSIGQESLSSEVGHNTEDNMDKTGGTGETIDNVTNQLIDLGLTEDLKSTEHDAKSEDTNTPVATPNEVTKSGSESGSVEHTETANEDEPSTIGSKEVMNVESGSDAVENKEPAKGDEKAALRSKDVTTAESGSHGQVKGTELATGIRQVAEETAHGASQIPGQSNARSGNPSSTGGANIASIKNLFKMVVNGQGVHPQKRVMFLTMTNMMSHVWMIIEQYEAGIQLDEVDIRDIKRLSGNIVLAYGKFRNEVQTEVNRLKDMKMYLPTLEWLNDPNELHTALNIWREKLKPVKAMTPDEAQLYDVWAKLYDSMVYHPFLKVIQKKPMPEEWGIPVHLQSVHSRVKDLAVLAKEYYEDTEKLKDRVTVALGRMREFPDFFLHDHHMDKAEARLEKFFSEEEKKNMEQAGKQAGEQTETQTGGQTERKNGKQTGKKNGKKTGKR